MKEVTYSVDWQSVTKAIVATHGVEDGHWMLDFIFESIPCTIPRMITQQVEGVFPGVVMRVISAKLIQVAQPNDRTITVVSGQIQENTDGPNTDNGGSKPSGKGSRKNRRSTR